MQRKPGFPATNCSIKLPDNFLEKNIKLEPDLEVSSQKRQQLINFAHSQWGLSGWSWIVTKQDLDFVDFNNGKYSAGVAAFVSVTVKGPHIHRGDVGYANTTASTKGAAIHQARKCAVTNALRETLLSFGGSIATDLMDLIESSKIEQPNQDATTSEKLILKTLNPVQNEVKNVPQSLNRATQKETSDNNHSRENSVHINPVQNSPAVKNILPAFPPPLINTNQGPQIVKSTFPANQGPPKPATAAPVPQTRPNSNISLPQQSSSSASAKPMTDEEMRAERKRRQKIAQEEFRLKQLQPQKHDSGNENDYMEEEKCSYCTEDLLIFNTQDIIRKATGVDQIEMPALKKPCQENH